MFERLLGHAPSLQEKKHTLDIHPHTGKLSLGYYTDGRWMPVYYRSVSEYLGHTKMPRDIINMIVQNEYQLIDVGAGLAELAPAISKVSIKKPIVIDPLDYVSIQKLLIKASKKNVSHENKELIDVLLERVELYLDHNAIQLIPLTVQEAYNVYGDRLRGVADVVTDVAGAIYYSGEIGANRDIYNLENVWLLNPSPKGTLYTDQGWIAEN